MERTTIFDDRCNSELPLINRRFTDVIASYIVIDSIKCFYQTPSPIIINNYPGYMRFIHKTEKYLKTNCSYIKEKNNIDEIELFYEFTVTKKGKVINLNYLGSYPEILKPDDTVLEKELLTRLEDHPKFIPARLKQKRVYYYSSNSIIF
jgi:hypothetical protein